LANSAIFAAGSLDTTASTLSAVLWQLARHPAAYDRVMDEINSVMGDDLSKPVTYEDHNKMTYLEACVHETLRADGIGFRLMRQATVDTVIPDTDIKIPKGTAISIALGQLHWDEKNFRNPHEFQPERFLPENKSDLKSCTYMVRFEVVSDL